MDVFAHCRELITAHDKERNWASLYAPAARRNALYALYAFDLELAAIRDRVREPITGEIRLQWWRDVLNGERAGEAAAHPVAAALVATLQRFAVKPTLLQQVIDARAFDVRSEPMATIADFEHYGAATAGVIFAVAAQILGGHAQSVRQIASDCGIAQMTARCLVDLPRDRARNKIFLPLEMLDRYGARREDLLAGRATFELRAALGELRLMARRQLTEAGVLISSLSSDVLPAFLPAALIRPQLAAMEARGYDPFRPRRFSPLYCQWLIWRAARNPGRIFN